MKRLLFAAFVLWFCAGSVFAQQRPVTFVLGYSAGGLADQITRALAKAFQDSTGRETRVENVLGMGGETAAIQVASRANDGSVVFLHNWYFANAQAASLLPLAEVGYSALGIWRNQSSSNLSNVNFGGDRASYVFAYTSPETLKKLAGVQFVRIPHKGVAPAVFETSTAGGWFVGDLSNKGGASLASFQLVGTTAPSETAKLGWPDLPSQNVLFDSEFTYPIAVYVPPGTPQAVQNDLRAQLANTVGSAAFGDRARGMGVIPNYRERSDQQANLRPAWALSLAGNAAIRSGAPIEPPAAVYSSNMTAGATQTLPNAAPIRDDPKTIGRGARGG